MKFNKKLFSLLFVALLALVLVGCNGGETTEVPTTEAPTTEAPTTEEPTTEEPTTEEPTTMPVDFQPALDYLDTEYEDTLLNDNFEATEDLTLVNSYEEFTFTWSSSNTDYLANDGTISRPLMSEGNQTVVLTVTISHGEEETTQDFFVTIKALEEKTAEEIAEEVFLFVFAIPNQEFWTSADELNLVTVGEDTDGVEYDVTWATSHPEYITTEGEIIQPEGEDVDVTLTATITVDDTEFSEERVFTVAQMAEGTEVATIAEAIDMGEGSYVEIPGVTVIAMYDSGDVFFTDGTDILYIYSPPFEAEIGGVYDITGSIGFYFNAPQLVGSDTHPLRAVESDAAVTSAPVIDATGIEDIISATSVPTTENPHEYVKYNVTAKVYYEESWGNYSLFLVPTDYDFDADLASGAEQPNGDAIMIYYRSDMDVLEAFHGKEVTIDIIMQGYRTDKTIFYANFFGTAVDVEAVIADDTEAVNIALEALIYPETIIEDTVLTLPTELYGVDLTWTSSHDTVIDPATGIVDAEAQTSQVMVTLTVNAERNGVTDSKTYEIGVGEMPVTTITDVLAESSGTFKIEGTIISGEYQNTYFIQDETGNIALYTDGNAAIETLLEDNIGNVVYVTGTRDAYNGLEQIRVETVEYVEEGSIPEPTNLDSMELTSTVLADYQSQLIELTGMIVTDRSEDSWGNVYLTLTHPVNGTTIDVKWDSRVDLPTELNTALQSVSINEIINIQAILAWNDGPLIYIVTTADIEEVELTTEQKVAADIGELDFGGNVYEETDVTLPSVGSNGSTITWEITAGETNATLTDGVLTLDAVTDEATVEITATLTLDDVTDTAVFTYTLKNLVMVDLVDFPSQTLGDVVSVSGVVYAVIGNGFFIEDSTGKLFVFDYDATYDLGDEVELTGTVAEYNGAYQLTDSDLAPALSTGNDYEQTPLDYEHGTTTLEPGQTYTVFGTVALEGQYDNVYIYVNETDAFEIYYQSPDDSIAALEAMEGKEVAVNIIYYNDDTSFVYVEGTEGVSEVITDLSTLHAMTNGTDYDIPADTMVYVKGVVVADIYDGFFIQDENGNGILVDDLDATVGDEVIYSGTLELNYDVRELQNASEVEVVSSGNALVYQNLTADEINALDASDTGTLITFTGLEVASYDSGSYPYSVTFNVEGTTETTQLTLRFFSTYADWLEDAFAVGDTLPEVSFVYFNYRDGDNQIEALDIEMTDEIAIQLDADALPTDLTLTDDYVIPAPVYDTTYTVTNVSSELDAYIDETTTPGTLLVTQPASGESDATGTITIQVEKGSASPVDVVINVTIPAEVDLSSETTYTETFTNFALSGNSYSDGTFTGDNSNDWSYTDARGDFDLDGQAIMLKGGGSLSATIQGGIYNFSVDYYDAYSGAAEVELWINGVLIATSDAFDDDGDGSVYGTFSVDGIAVTGEFTIEIVSGDSQMVLDNLTWTSYSPA
ncbi:MAG: immunoglobulin-like domain-containing protein [Candidatus Izemoplasmatales bacterium]